ncbi:hypothetical protein K2Z83_15635 [Oscillochloris sp. ZM17-4]|uniref:ATP-dependent DNA ligase n=1 Tax=Oscillochloris sp. ZM17-4 TaxID=2866714 RepID=UPI001C73B599|nr:RNA ligase family protein [Oscillochloris sp. ZM17-4]MBX0329109.1 hypothetical protein [Oscillochloris sp. ZM17-4]
MPANLIGFLGGVAASGARYKIEIRDLGGGAFEATALNAGGATGWSRPTLIKAGAIAEVIKAASTKFAEKTRPGRDRMYTRPFGGGPLAEPFPKGVTSLPDHPLCWRVGDPLGRLPAELHAEASGSAGPGAVAAPLTVPPATPTFGQVVMLCETVPSWDDFLPYLTNADWILTEKLEGDRGQLHHHTDGQVYLTNRSGEIINCPAHIAKAMRDGTTPGTSLDGEVISVDRDGRAQLYVGAQADIQLFVAFDLLAIDGRSMLHERQCTRLRRLEGLLPTFEPPIQGWYSPVRAVRWSSQDAGKSLIVDEVRQRQGEGWVLRQADAPYEGKRSRNWLRFRDREKEMDVVVIDYREGTGRLKGTVGAIKVGLYEGRSLYAIGWVGSGWDDTQRRTFWEAWHCREAGQVVVIKSFGLSFADQVIRPSGVRVRAEGDKQPVECQFSSEVGRDRVSAPKVL